MQKLQNTISGIKKTKLNTLTSNIHLNNTDQIILTTWQHHIKKGLSNLLKANLNSVLRRPRNFVNITEDIGERVYFQVFRLQP